MNTSEFLTIASSICPDRTATVFEGRRRTYEQMNEHVNRIANFLAGMGVEKGTKVAILNTNSDDYVDIYYATARLGAIFVPSLKS